MNNWDLFKLLCRIIGGQDSTALSIVIQKKALIRLVELAGEYELLPAVAARINEQRGLSSDIPAELNHQLQQSLKQNTGHKLQMIAQAVKVARVLNTAGIEPMFLKGTALLLADTQVPTGFRKQLDIDLLVAPQQIEAACEALKSDGYRFYDFEQSEPKLYSNINQAVQRSAHHHHLPEMGKQDYNTLLELHKEPLPRRFQKQLCTKNLLQAPIPVERHGARFYFPAAELQLMHLVLGSFVNDSYASAYNFPIRAGHDYIETANQGSIQEASMSKASKEIQVFEQLVVELMKLPEEKRLFPAIDVSRRLALMEKRFNSPATARLLAVQARWRHLGNALWYDAGKLPAYLLRNRI